MFKKYSKQQILQLSAAVLFLIGAVFMLIRTFTEAEWAFWTGLGFAVVALGLYIWLILENRKLFTQRMKNAPKSETDTDKQTEKEA